MTRYPRKQLALRRAREELEAAGVDHPPVRVEEIARSHGLVIRYEPSDEDVSGALYLDGRRGIIGVNRKHHRNRQRFTIAHELGHFLLHAKTFSAHRVFLDRRFVWNRDGRAALGVHPEEVEANQFAAELLVPRQLLEEDLQGGSYDVEDDGDLKKLASRYQVSLQTLNFRLRGLGIVSGFGE